MDKRDLASAADDLGVDPDKLAEKIEDDPAFGPCVNGLDDPAQLPPIDE